jgi:hypothetical protein
MAVQQKRGLDIMHQQQGTPFPTFSETLKQDNLVSPSTHKALQDTTNSKTPINSQ